MTTRQNVLSTIALVSLVLTGVSILVFGLIAVFWSGSRDAPWLRATGVASIGMGLFGLGITVVPYRRRENWAWFTLWYYPVFWLAHLIAELPPGRDHVHQIVFIMLSLIGLLIPIREFFPAR